MATQKGISSSLEPEASCTGAVLVACFLRSTAHGAGLVASATEALAGTGGCAGGSDEEGVGSAVGLDPQAEVGLAVAVAVAGTGAGAGAEVNPLGTARGVVMETAWPPRVLNAVISFFAS